MVNDSFVRKIVENVKTKRDMIEIRSNDQAELQADRARNSFLKAGEVGKWSSLHNQCGWKHRLNLRLNQLLGPGSPIDM